MEMNFIHKMFDFQCLDKAAGTLSKTEAHNNQCEFRLEGVCLVNCCLPFHKIFDKTLLNTDKHVCFVFMKGQ